MIMTYGTWTARIEIDDGEFHGTVLNTRDVIDFYGGSYDDLEREFANSLNVYLDVCREKGIEPRKAYSGKFPLRVSPDLHEKAVAASANLGVSVNAWITGAIEKAVESQPAGEAERPKKGWRRSA